jgi:hypothetical protein
MSIYDPVRIGTVEITPNMINADYVLIDLSVISSDEGTPQPYSEDGAIYIPVRAWESMQASAPKDV